MSTKNLRKFPILIIAAVMTVFALLPAQSSAQVMHLQAGTTIVNSSQASCDAAVLPTNNPGIVMGSACTPGRLTMALQGNLAPGAPKHIVDIEAFSRLIVQFQVDTQPGAPNVSFLPISITVAVNWKGTIGDSSFVPPAFAPVIVGSFADVNGQLYLATGQAGTLQLGPTVETNNFMAATHAGVTGCLTIPKGPAAALAMMSKCAADGLKKEEGNGTFNISGVIQTGQTYDIVIELLGHTFGHGGGVNGCTPDGCGVVDFQRTVLGDPDPSAGLFWSGSNPMTITIGTDFGKEIGDLQNQLNQLRQEFKTHTHIYLTGKGVGQNNTPAKTSTPLFIQAPLFP